MSNIIHLPSKQDKQQASIARALEFVVFREDEAEAVAYNKTQVESLLSLTFRDFIGRVSSISFKSFILSYCANRSRPGMDMHNGDNKILSELDHLVLLLVMRVVTASVEDQVYLPSNLNSLFLLRLPVLADICTIIGDSNAELSKMMMSSTVQLKIISNELTVMFNETDEIVSDVLSSIKSLILDSSTPTSRKKGAVDLKKKDNKDLSKSKLFTSLEKGTNEKMKSIQQIDTNKVLDMAMYVYDISLSTSCFLRALPFTTFISNKILIATGSRFGSLGIQIMKTYLIIHDDILPMLLDIIDKTKSTSSETEIEEVLKYIKMAKSRILMAFEEFISTASFINSSSENTSENDGDDGDESLSWTDMLGYLLERSNEEDVKNSSIHYTFIMNVYENFGTRIKELVTNSFEEDEETVKYLYQAISANIPSMTESNNSNRNNIIEMKKKVQSYYPEKQNESKELVHIEKKNSLSNEAKMEHIGSVRMIFPDLGEGFTYACLEAFDWSPDRTIDALLSDNLPPAIASLDRTKQLSLERITMKMKQETKEKKDNVPQILRKFDKDVVLGDSIDHEFRRLLAERLVAEEKQTEEDTRLMQTYATEYSDDYDDQYDDVRGSSTKSSAAAAAKKADIAIDWGVNSTKQMAEMKRVNQLIRDKLKEEAFWKDMRNTNHDIRPEEGEGEGVEMNASSTTMGKKGVGGAKSTTNPNGDQSKNSNRSGGRGAGGGRGGGGRGDGGGRGKPRTKTFDKHRQKDKSLKKSGGP